MDAGELGLRHSGLAPGSMHRRMPPLCRALISGLLHRSARRHARQTLDMWSHQIGVPSGARPYPPRRAGDRHSSHKARHPAPTSGGAATPDDRMLAWLAVWHNHRVFTRGIHTGMSRLHLSGMTAAPTDWLVALGYPPAVESEAPAVATDTLVLAA